MKSIITKHLGYYRDLELLEEKIQKSSLMSLFLNYILRFAWSIWLMALIVLIYFTQTIVWWATEKIWIFGQTILDQVPVNIEMTMNRDWLLETNQSEKWSIILLDEEKPFNIATFYPTSFTLDEEAEWILNVYNDWVFIHGGEENDNTVLNFKELINEWSESLDYPITFGYDDIAEKINLSIEYIQSNFWGIISVVYIVILIVVVPIFWLIVGLFLSFLTLIHIAVIAFFVWIMAKLINPKSYSYIFSMLWRLWLVVVFIDFITGRSMVILSILLFMIWVWYLTWMQSESKKEIDK